MDVDARKLVTLGFPFLQRGALTQLGAIGSDDVFAVPAIVRALVEEFERKGGTCPLVLQHQARLRARGRPLVPHPRGA